MRRWRILGLGACLVGMASVGQGATTPNSAIAVQTPKLGVVQFLQGTDSAGTYKTLYTAGADGSKCVGMTLTTNDDVSHLVTIQVVRSAVKYGGTSVSVPASAGFASTVAPIAGMAVNNWVGLPTDTDGNPYLTLESGDTIQATFATAFSTAGELINILAVCGNF